MVSSTIRHSSGKYKMATQGFSISVSISHMISFYRVSQMAGLSSVCTWANNHKVSMIRCRSIIRQDKTLLRRECKLGLCIIHTHTHMWRDICVSAVPPFPLEVGYTNTCPVGFHPYLMGQTGFAHYYGMMSGSEWIHPAFSKNVE